MASAHSHIEHGDRRRRSRVDASCSRAIAPYVGGASILVVGAIHAQQYYREYFSAVPTIGTLFLLSTRSRRSADAEPEEVHVS